MNFNIINKIFRRDMNINYITINNSKSLSVIFILKFLKVLLFFSKKNTI